MKRSLVIMMSLCVYTSLMGTTQDNFVKKLLSSYALTSPKQEHIISPEPSAVTPIKTQSRYRKLFKQAEGIFLVLLLDVVLIRAMREHELPQAKKIIEDQQAFIEKQNEKIKNIGTVMVEEVTKVAEEKLQSDATIQANNKQSFEHIGKKVQNFYVELLGIIHDLENEVAQLKKQILVSENSNAANTEQLLPNITERLNVLEKKQLTEDFKRRQFDKNKEFEDAIEVLKKQLSSDNLKNNGAHTL